MHEWQLFLMLGVGEMGGVQGSEHTCHATSHLQVRLRGSQSTHRPAAWSCGTFILTVT